MVWTDRNGLDTQHCFYFLTLGNWRSESGSPGSQWPIRADDCPELTNKKTSSAAPSRGQCDQCYLAPGVRQGACQPGGGAGGGVMVTTLARLCDVWCTSDWWHHLVTGHCVSQKPLLPSGCETHLHCQTQPRATTIQPKTTRVAVKIQSNSRQPDLGHQPEILSRDQLPNVKILKEKSIKQTRIGHFLSWLAH